MKFTRYQKLLIGICLVSIVALILAIFEIIRGNIGGFEPIFYGIGFLFFSAFNWADVLVFSLLWILLSSILWKLKNRLYLQLAFFSFWLVRSEGETIYSFLQQFNPHVHPWLAYTPRVLLQNNFIGHFIFEKFWVVEQIFFQSISVLSLFGLLYTLYRLFKKTNSY